MVSKRGIERPPTAPALPVAGAFARTYLVVTAVTLATLAVLSFTASPRATANAWGHAIVVAVFAIVLPLRLRRAQTGERGAVRAVGLISAVLLLVNVVEALIPGFVPVWMEVDMVLVALLMAGILVDVARWAVMKKD